VALYKDGVLQRPQSYAYTFPDRLAFHDSPTVVEQKLFVMFLEHRMRTLQGTFHANPDYALWYGWSEMQRDLTEIKSLASHLRDKARQTQTKLLERRGAIRFELNKALSGSVEIGHYRIGRPFRQPSRPAMIAWKLGRRQGTFVPQGSEVVARAEIKARPGLLFRTNWLSGLRGQFGKGSQGTMDYWLE
jgi:hypothetical protein